MLMLLPAYQPRDSVALTGTASQTARFALLTELADLGFPLGETITAAGSYARLAGWQDVHADSLLLEQAIRTASSVFWRTHLQRRPRRTIGDAHVLAAFFVQQ